MNYTFDIGWFFAGLAILVGGGLVVVFYKQISDGLANGVSSYDHVKLFGVIAIVVGFLIMANLHTFVLGLILGLFGIGK